MGQGGVEGWAGVSSGAEALREPDFFHKPLPRLGVLEAASRGSPEPRSESSSEAYVTGPAEGEESKAQAAGASHHRQTHVPTTQRSFIQRDLTPTSQQRDAHSHTRTHTHTDTLTLQRRAMASRLERAPVPSPAGP